MFYIYSYQLCFYLFKNIHILAKASMLEVLLNSRIKTVSEKGGMRALI